MADTTDKDTATKEAPSTDSSSTFTAMPTENEGGTPPAMPETTAPDTQAPRSSDEDQDESLSTSSDVTTPEGVNPEAVAESAKLQDGKPTVEPSARPRTPAQPPEGEEDKPEEVLGQDKTAGWQMKGWWEARFGYSPTEQLKEALGNSSDAWKIDRKGNFRLETPNGKKLFVGEKNIEGERKIVVEKTGWGFNMDNARQMIEAHKSLGSRSIEFHEGSRKSKAMLWAMATHNGIKVRNYKPTKRALEELMKLRRDEVLKNEAAGDGGKPDAPGVTKGDGAQPPGVTQGGPMNRLAGVSPDRETVIKALEQSNVVMAKTPVYEQRAKKPGKVARSIENGQFSGNRILNKALKERQELSDFIKTIPNSQKPEIQKRLDKAEATVGNARRFLDNLHELGKNPDKVAQIENDPGKLKSMRQANDHMMMGRTTDALIKQTAAGINRMTSRKSEPVVSNMPEAKSRPAVSTPKMSGPKAGGA